MDLTAQFYRKRLENRLLGSRSFLLWSYNKEGISSLSDQLIIGRFLSFGNREEWNDLKQAFSTEQIKDVWKNEMLLGQYQSEKQKELVRFFFGSKDPKQYIYKNRKRALANIFERGF